MQRDDTSSIQDQEPHIDSKRVSERPHVTIFRINSLVDE